MVTATVETGALVQAELAVDERTLRSVPYSYLPTSSPCWESMGCEVLTDSKGCGRAVAGDGGEVHKRMGARVKEPAQGMGRHKPLRNIPQRMHGGSTSARARC